MRRFFITGVAALAAAACVATAAVAANPHTSGTPGQPSQMCLSSNAMSEPGNAASSSGSPFNEPSSTSNGGTAGRMYAGSGENTETPANGNAVSQYDVACFQVSSNH